ncbi:DUF2892 domain-containing protein [Rhodobacter sp. NTK016B]|uniref:YgaP family membrane protein n=1 Tax=Rhodobacter sp. NTK016B TaxID=2759676 RepID=UPI001A8D29E0|nr:DUF2892 domain-containing protein [Rhodobacter sp. NTK016B]MBN8291373.1 DUF2892 domain-containing protein [Rhodobacter sp. NTK016B]
MFARNEGGLDRALRVIVGLALIAGFFVFPEAPYRWAFLLGLVPLVTGLVGTCPLYSLLRINTCPTKRP